MFDRKFIISVVVIFVMSMAFGFLVHGTILHDEYAKLVPNVMRSPESAQAYFVWMLLGTLAFAIGFSWVYLRGREAKPWLGQGFRYGLAMALVGPVSWYLIYYSVMPFPSDLVAQQAVFGSISVVIMGLAVAWINR